MTKELLKKGCNPNLTQDSKSGENCLHLLMYKMCYSRLSTNLNGDKNSIKKIPKDPKSTQDTITNEETRKSDKMLDLLLNGGMDIHL